MRLLLVLLFFWILDKHKILCEDDDETDIWDDMKDESKEKTRKYLELVENRISEDPKYRKALDKLFEVVFIFEVFFIFRLFSFLRLSSFLRSSSFLR